MDWLFYAPALALIAASVADILTTAAALDRGGRETNPVIRWAMRWGGMWWIVAKLAVVGGLIWAGYATGYSWALYIGAAMTGFAAWRNTRVNNG